MDRNFVLFIIVIMTSLSILNVKAKDEHLYTPCHTGKGSITLYNCGRNQDNLARLQLRTTPIRYIIKLKGDVDSTKVDEICSIAETNNTSYTGYCINKYNTNWKGMLLVIKGEDLYQLLEDEMDFIEHIEVEGVVRVSQLSTVSNIGAQNITQTNPSNWGLDRIDHESTQPLLNNVYTVADGGTSVHVYVVDTGIRCSHKDFYYMDGRLDSSKKSMSRCLSGFDAIGDGYQTNDCNGHGTHCAGIAVGLQSGVAKDAFVHPIRALGCDGSGGYGSIMASLEWINYNAITPCVVSMSLASQASISIDQAILNLMNTKGILIVVAAGNYHDDACNYSPARVLSTLSVGSSTKKNLMSWFSNYGSCTTIFGPGELITSAWNTSDSAYYTQSGTSMACPHVAGAAALYIGKYVDARPKDVRQALLDACEPGAVSNVQPNTTTKLLNVVNMMDPIFNITPRAFYNALEGTIQNSTISLEIKPRNMVIFTPIITDSTIGYFQPSSLYFASDSTWSIAQTIKLIVLNRTDFLDRGCTIQWSFTSKDTRFNIVPEGYIMSIDTGLNSLPIC